MQICRSYYQITPIGQQHCPSAVSESPEFLCATFEASWAARGATRMRLIGRELQHWVSINTVFGLSLMAHFADYCQNKLILSGVQGCGSGFGGSMRTSPGAD